MKKLALLLIPAFIIVGCKKDENKSDEAQILGFSIVNTSISDFTLEEIFIDDNFNHVLVLSQNDLAEENPPLMITPEISISEGAIINPQSGQEVSFANKDGAVTYVVTAENGNQSNWTFTIRDMQIPNSGFEDWFDTVGVNGIPYPEPGLSALSTVWATANMGTSIYGIYGTQPIDDGGNTLAIIVSGETSTIPITSGTLFTGKFDIQAVMSNPTEPSKGTDFGIPFTFRPTALKLKYKFSPGEIYIDGDLIDPNSIIGGFIVDTIDGSDECSIWSDLEIRNGNTIQRIGRAEFTSGEKIEEMTGITIPYIYSSDEKPTHISIVLSSSKDGEEFRGSVGTTLIVDDVELIYE